MSFVLFRRAECCFSFFFFYPFIFLTPLQVSGISKKISQQDSKFISRAPFDLLRMVVCRYSPKSPVHFLLTDLTATKPQEARNNLSKLLFFFYVSVNTAFQGQHLLPEVDFHFGRKTQAFTGNFPFPSLFLPHPVLPCLPSMNFSLDILMKLMLLPITHNLVPTQELLAK